MRREAVASVAVPCLRRCPQRHLPLRSWRAGWARPRGCTARYVGRLWRNKNQAEAKTPLLWLGCFEPLERGERVHLAGSFSAAFVLLGEGNSRERGREGWHELGFQRGALFRRVPKTSPGRELASDLKKDGGKLSRRRGKSDAAKEFESDRRAFNPNASRLEQLARGLQPRVSRTTEQRAFWHCQGSGKSFAPRRVSSFGAAALKKQERLLNSGGVG